MMGLCCGAPEAHVNEAPPLSAQAAGGIYSTSTAQATKVCSPDRNMSWRDMAAVLHAGADHRGRLFTGQVTCKTASSAVMRSSTVDKQFLICSAICNRKGSEWAWAWAWLLIGCDGIFSHSSASSPEALPSSPSSREPALAQAAAYHIQPLTTIQRLSASSHRHLV